jgi:O-antigen ligase
MKITSRKIYSVLLYSAILLFSFEQATFLTLGFVTELKPYRVLLIVAGVLLLWYPIRLDQQSKRLAFLIFAIYFGGLLIAMLRTIVGTADIFIALVKAKLFLIAFVFYLLPICTIHQPKQIIRLSAIILISAALSTCIYFLTINDMYFYRFSGFFRNPNHFGYLIGLSIVITFYFLAWKQYKPVFFFPLLIWIFISALLLILSGSRSAILATVLTLALLLYRCVSLSGVSRGNRIVIGLGVALVLTVALPYAINSNVTTERLMDRFSVINMATGAGRFDLWRAGLLAAEDFLFTGLGMGQYLTVHSYYIRQISGNIYVTLMEFDLGLHNEYLNLLVEFGLFALLAYVVVIFYLWRGVWKFGRNNQKWLHISALAEAYLIFNILFSASQDMYNFPLNWLALGICATLIKLRGYSVISKAK